MKSAIEIANSAELLPISDVAAAAGIRPDELVPYGRDRGKVRAVAVLTYARGHYGYRASSVVVTRPVAMS